jgi:hypothetical protein
MKNITLAIGFLLMPIASWGQSNQVRNKPYIDHSPGYDIAVYYFPNYHMTDPRQQQRYSEAWSEWDLVKTAKPRFTGHEQPKVPIWGYTDESNPEVMKMKIDAASSHGIDAFIYDWYWYDDSLFLGKGLEDGFMKAPNNSKMKFSLMWANHNWIDIFPRKLNDQPSSLLYKGSISAEKFDKMTDYIIQKYFKHPSYWLVDGCPYFSIYELYTFIDGIGGIDSAKVALDKFREKTKKAGFKGLHLNAVSWGVQIKPEYKGFVQPNDILNYLNISSTTSYVWIHHTNLPDFPQTEYSVVRDGYMKYANEYVKQTTKPYYLNVTMGWDATPRCGYEKPFGDYGYPCMPTVKNNTPEAFKLSLQLAKKWTDENVKGTKIITINSWNEWTEGSYLEPERKYGYQYLEALKEVFKKNHCCPGKNLKS